MQCIFMSNLNLLQLCVYFVKKRELHLVFVYDFQNFLCPMSKCKEKRRCSSKVSLMNFCVCECVCEWKCQLVVMFILISVFALDLGPSCLDSCRADDRTLIAVVGCCTLVVL